MDFQRWNDRNLKGERELTLEFMELAKAVVAAIGAPKPYTNTQIFDALVQVCAGQYEYLPTGGTRAFILEKKISCMSATEIFIGMVLYLRGISLDEGDQIVHTYHVPILSAGYHGAPANIPTNIVEGGGGGRILFSGGHTIAWLDHIQYDLLAGQHAVNLPFVHGIKTSDAPITIQCNVAGVAYTFTWVDSRATDYLSEFKVEPDLA